MLAGIFSFQPPVNILALLILWPARFFMDAHHYHQTIVFCARVSNAPLLLVIRLVERYFLFADPEERPLWKRLLPFDLQSSRLHLDDIFDNEDDIDDDSLPVGAFNIHDGLMTPDPERERDMSPMRPTQHLKHASPSHMDREHERERERKEDKRRRAMSMSDWGASTQRSDASTIKARPAILSKLYAAKREYTWPPVQHQNDEEHEAIKDRLERIEEGQKRIEEALKGLGGGDDD